MRAPMTRKALVIGAGGVTGLAWSSGTLAALEAQTGWDPRTAGVVIGTSQGSYLGGLLASGISTAELTRWYRKELPDTHPLRTRAESRPAAAVRRRRIPVPASPALVARLGRISTLAALSGLVPAGGGSLDAFLAPLAALAGTTDWVDHPDFRVTALDYDNGRRVVFGAPGPDRPPALEAVRASCTVPGGFPPVVINGRRFIDGGAHSTTNADLALNADLDEVVVLAPMAGEGRGLLRGFANRHLRAEVAALRSAGVAVRVLTPTAEDVAVMGANPQDPAQRFRIFDTALASGPRRVERAYR
ncbi:patatin [Nocardioides humilatus]|uniref:Patatin n=1 Tax=Nocardioides humilatus TaxID=2607660 RepID=A0A5B1L856_9ACTN|nr:patatin-like phospholipase family protein [Nocardioides humilatus]KAA1415950.1 patatin [Nocardioides humilatus]